MKPITVLSLCDGMSCSQIALKDMGIPVKKYYASEVDKFAIQQTQGEFPNTEQLGSITEWRKWNIPWNEIDLLTAGTSCKGFSIAGKRLEFDDPESKHILDFFDILEHAQKQNPKLIWMLENVASMRKVCVRVISERLGLFPVEINSALVSAQSRKRLYWSNIQTKKVGLFKELHTGISQPEDRGILLKDILQPESEIDEKYYIDNPKMQEFILDELRQEKKFTQINGQGKSLTLLARTYANWNGDFICVSQVGRRFDENGTRKDYDKSIKTVQSLEVVPNEKARCLMTTNKDYVASSPSYRLRRLTLLECSRLQTVPTWHKWHVSESQAMKMLGNGWTIEAIKHIFSFINLE